MYYITLWIFVAAGVSAYVDPDSGSFCDYGGYRLCCNGRQDNCSRPRGYGDMATVCYCDRFCERSHPRPYETDCCPDYMYVCRNRTRPEPIIHRITTIIPNSEPNHWKVIEKDPEGCYYQGSYYLNNESFKDNCRQCMCKDMSNRMEILCSQDVCLIDQALIEDVNRRQAGWRAGNVTNFWGRTLDLGYNGMLGTSYSSSKVHSMYAMTSHTPKKDLPVQFDWRQAASYVTPIVDQGFCNASWSYSIVSTFSDRLAKATRWTDVDPLSYEQHRNCVKGQKGREGPCSPGYLTKAWKYLQRTGLLKESCYPSMGGTRCAKDQGHLSRMKNTTCTQGSRERIGKLYRTSVLSRIEGESTIMKQLLVNGPVVATMRVFPDLFVYNEGVYSCGRRRPKEGRLHSVKIVGWGEEYVQIMGRTTLVPYWIVANSWGTAWGENGYFKIRRGRNDCDIEEFILIFYAQTEALHEAGRGRKRRNLKPKNPFNI